MMIVGGRLRSKKGAAIVGGRVEVIDLANGGVIASGFSDVRGNFCLRVKPTWEAAQKTKGLAIRAVGKAMTFWSNRSGYQEHSRTQSP